MVTTPAQLVTGQKQGVLWPDAVHQARPQVCLVHLKEDQCWLWGIGPGFLAEAADEGNGHPCPKVGIEVTAGIDLAQGSGRGDAETGLCSICAEPVCSAAALCHGAAKEVGGAVAALNLDCGEEGFDPWSIPTEQEQSQHGV